MSTFDPSLDPLKPAGSPPTGEPAFLVVGKLRRPHGTRGEILMEVWTDFPERIKAGDLVYIGSSYQPITIRSLRWNNKMMLLTFQDHSTPEEVGILRNQWVYVRADDRPELEEGEYYHHQLIGLWVREESGGVIGVVSDILETGSNDVLVVKLEGSPDVLLPMIDSVVLNIDIESGSILVHLLPGLLP